MTLVRPATPADVDAVSSMVALAFAEDPAWNFMGGSARRGVMESFARALLLPRMLRRTVWVADDDAAVAMWDRRGDGDPEPGDDELWTAFRAEAGEDVWRRVSTYEDAVHAVAPPRPYWYLGVLATHPDARGRGVATAVLQPGFAAAAGDGWDCWLETSTPENKAFYAGRGFTDSVPVEVPGGPPTWWLRRPHLPGRR